MAVSKYKQFDFTYDDLDVEHSLPLALKSYYRENKDYVTPENAKNVITRTRERFQKALYQYKGPPFIPTIFKNHPDHMIFVRKRELRLAHIRNPQRPPFSSGICNSSFCDEIFMNLMSNLRNSNRLYIYYTSIAKVILLNKHSFGEMAMNELLSEKAFFYSSDAETIKKSPYVELDLKSWPVLPISCSNKYQFLVEFCMILPEKRVSPVVITCVDCGHFLETILFDNTIMSIKNEVEKNIAQTFFVNKEETCSSVIRLPTRASRVEGCIFYEGVLGVKALTGSAHEPSTYIRARITYYCNRDCIFSETIHTKCRNDKKANIYPFLIDSFAKLKIT